MKPVYGEGSGDFRTIGFWKQQFAIALGEKKGKPKVGIEELTEMLDELGETWTTYEGTTISSGYTMLGIDKQPIKKRKSESSSFKFKDR